MAISREVLAEIGSFLHGAEWRRALARDLGPHHPQGARTTIDPRLVARWDTGDRDIPEWIGAALVAVLTDRASQALALARRLQRGS